MQRIQSNQWSGGRDDIIVVGEWSEEQAERIDVGGVWEVTCLN